MMLATFSTPNLKIGSNLNTERTKLETTKENRMGHIFIIQLKSLYFLRMG